MIVFKSFLHVLNKNKGPVILFTVMLVIFGVLNFNNEDMASNFVSSKPDVFIVNKDECEGITKNFIDYIAERSNIIDLENDKTVIDDALFYRNVNFIIYIPSGFRSDTLNNKDVKLEVKSTKDYQASLASMMVNKYMNTLNLYNDYLVSEEELIKSMDETLGLEVPMEVTTKLDTNSLNKLTTYFNFMNYSLLAGLVYVICLVLTSFKSENIRKRTIVSSMKFTEFNRYLLLSNLLFAFVLWIIYIILAFVLLGNVMFSIHGLLCILNSLVFGGCALVIAFLLGNTIRSKNAINGIVNVIALGSSFLCGCFVPVEFMPESVINMGKVLPSYYYVNSNNLIKTMEKIDMNSMMPILKNFGVLIIYIVVIIIITNAISRKRRKIA